MILNKYPFAFPDLSFSWLTTIPGISLQILILLLIINDDY